jgi:protocatechuate 3,4-dioxygenase, alpha subunit
MESNADGLTPSQTIGPFFHGFLPVDGRLAGPDAQGERIGLSLRVLDEDAEPVSDAMVEVWQADAAGRYAHPDDAREGEPDPEFRGYGRLATDTDGVCVFETVRPGRVPGLNGAPQAPHVAVTILARGLLYWLATRVYFEGDPANEEDPVLASLPEHRRHTLLARPHPGAPAVWSLEIRLRGEDETVFFDV